MEAEFTRRRLSQVMASALFAASIAILGPGAPQAHADGWLPDCNSPGGSYLCEKAKEGAKWLVDNTPGVEAIQKASKVVDFASDPFGYIEQKLQSGAKEMFEAFGEELTGKKPPHHGKGKKSKDPKGG